MMRFLLTLTFSFLFFISAAQSTNELDSLQKVLSGKKLDDKRRIETLLELIKYHFDNDPKKSLAYSDSAIAIASPPAKQSKYLSQIYLYKGTAYKKQSLYVDALRNFNKAFEEIERVPNKKIEANLYYEMSNVYGQMNEQTKALEFGQKGLDVFKILKDTLGIIDSYNSIGIIYWDEKEFEKSKAYYKKAIYLNKAKRNDVANARLLNNVGLLFKDTNQNDSALFYFNEALKNLDIGKNTFGVALINNNIGIAYRDTKRYSLALSHFMIAKDLQIKLNDPYGIGLSNQNISETYFLQKNYSESLVYLTEGLTYAQKTGNLDLLRDITVRMASSYEGLNDFKNAFIFQKQAKLYDDSLKSKSLGNKIADLEVKYQVKQQQAENDLLKAENDLNAITIKNNNLILIGAIVFSFLVIVLLIAAYRLLRIRKKANKIIEVKNLLLESVYKQVEQQKKAIEEQKDEIITQNEELSTKNKYLEELNYEKSSLMGIVAHDLKSPFNSITGIVNILPNLGPLNEQQKEFVGLITKVVTDSTSLIQDLMDLSALENKDMKVHFEPVSMNALLINLQTRYQAQADQKGITIEIAEKIDDSITLESDSQHIDRILQNLISNALKFSEAGTQVKIGALVDGNQIQFYVKDQGPGISEEDQKYLFRKFQKLSARPTNGESSSGLGLSIVKALIEELGGSIKVVSELKRGTNFICALPINS